MPSSLWQMSVQKFSPNSAWKCFLRHGHPGQSSDRVERTLYKVFDLKDFRQIAQHLDDAELLPGLEVEIHDGQRTFLGLLRQHAILGDTHLAAQLEEAVVMAVFLHHDPAGQPLGVGRGRERDRRLVIDARAVELVDRVADHDLAAALPVLLRRAAKGLHASTWGKSLMPFLSLIRRLPSRLQYRTGRRGSPCVRGRARAGFRYSFPPSREDRRGRP